MRVDLHVHTQLCGHASGSAEEMARAAANVGLDIVAITDHLPLPPGYDGSYAMSDDQLAGYVADVQRVAAAFEAEPGFPRVLLGVEADWLPGREDELARLLGRHPFDMVLGAVHFLEGWAFDDPSLLEEWDRRDTGSVWRAYFAEVERAAASGLFDVMAHPDLVKKFGHTPGFDPAPLYRSAAAVFSEAGVAVEVSTAGLRKPVREMYPSRAFLTECRAQGVRVTIGSDAHEPDEVGYERAAAEKLLLSAGYESLVVFKGRQAEEVPIGES